MSIVVERLTHIYHSGAPNACVALRDVDLRIEDGTCAAVVGLTGSGKSTLIQHFNGLLRPTSGRVVVAGVEITARGMPPDALRELRRQVGLLFQFPEHQLFARSVFEDVAFGPRRLGLSEREVEERVRWALAAVALDGNEALLYRSPFTLSGGQRRRVAVAGVLAMRPRILVLDEPTAGLDGEARAELHAQLAALRAEEGITLVLVTHDLSEVALLAERVIVLADGAVRLDGPPMEVFARTADLSACGLVPPPMAEVLAWAQARGYQLAPSSLAPPAMADALAREYARRWKAASAHGAGGGHTC